MGWYLCWWIINPRGVPSTHPVVSASTLTWFIRYIYYWNLQFLKNEIIIKTKVLLPTPGNISWFWLSYWVTLVNSDYPIETLWLPCSQRLLHFYLSFQSFNLERTYWWLFHQHVMYTILISTCLINEIFYQIYVVKIIRFLRYVLLSGFCYVIMLLFIIITRHLYSVLYNNTITLSAEFINNISRHFIFILF